MALIRGHAELVARERDLLWELGYLYPAGKAYTDRRRCCVEMAMSTLYKEPEHRVYDFMLRPRAAVLRTCRREGASRWDDKGMTSHLRAGGVDIGFNLACCWLGRWLTESNLEFEQGTHGMKRWRCVPAYPAGNAFVERQRCRQEICQSLIIAQ